MLNLHKKDIFKYHMTRILEGSSMPEEQRQTFMANVLSKAGQASIDSAKDYINSVVAEGHLEQEVADKLVRLLNEYSTRR
jgi:hypothetical protein